MKITVVFYSLHVCPWIPGERNNFPILVGNIFFPDISGKFGIQDDTLLEKNFKQVFFFT
jgi:hypothetical protein